ncbi:HMG_(high mobility group) box protein [Hexamita inflata]|uniref:HMG (High mobility group) box protein n=1 Tax=Hexamita inflata TaxID=28002 RepID=A0AA86TRS9_9EUKA|nr:HMG (high mobility group) box protein [Hexamita inflata]
MERPTAPKAATGFMLFSNMVQKKHEAIKSITERATIIGAEWKALPQEVRDEYNNQCKKLNDEYSMQLEKYYKKNPQERIKDEEKKLHDAHEKFFKTQENGFPSFAILHAYPIKDQIFDKKKLLKQLKEFYEAQNKEIYIEQQKKLSGEFKNQLKEDFIKMFSE